MIKRKTWVQFEQCLRDSHLECRISVRVVHLCGFSFSSCEWYAGDFGQLTVYLLQSFAIPSNPIRHHQMLLNFAERIISNLKTQWIGTSLARLIYREWSARRSSEKRTLDSNWVESHAIIKWKFVPSFLTSCSCSYKYNTLFSLSCVSFFRKPFKSRFTVSLLCVQTTAYCRLYGLRIIPARS